MDLPRIVIGFGHRRRRGKDLCCELAAGKLRELGAACRIDHFAYSLKEAVRVIFGLSDDQLYGAAKLQEDVFWKDTPRNILQLVGTECMRNGYAQDIWARTLERRAAADPMTSVMIGDVRFPNEVAAIRRLGGMLVRVDREVAETDEDRHLSETALTDWDDWDYVIRNDGSLNYLHEQVHEVLCVCHPAFNAVLNGIWLKAGSDV